MNWHEELRCGWCDAMLIVRLAFILFPFAFGVSWCFSSPETPLPLWGDVLVTGLFFAWGIRCVRTYPWKDLAARLF